MKVSAGIVIILNDSKILLCHPTKSSWNKTYTPPKGGPNFGETILETAIRETEEETSLIIEEDQILNINDPIIVDYKYKKGELYKQVYLFLVKIKNTREIGMYSETIPKKDLQLDEIDWCGFLDKKEAKSRILPRFDILLDLIK